MVVWIRCVVLGVILLACSKSKERIRSREAPLVVVDASGNFGPQAVTTTSAPRTFTVLPAPPSNSLQFDQIDSIESSCPEFLVAAADAPGATVERTCAVFSDDGYGSDPVCIQFAETTYSFQVRFAPLQQGATSAQCKVFVRLDGGSSIAIPVSGIGIAPPLSAVISPRVTIDFLSVNVGIASGPRTIQVTNTGSQALTVMATTVLDGNVFAVQGNTASHSLPPNQSTVYTVTCTPNAVATFNNGSITIATNDPDPNDASVTIPFICEGVDHPIRSTDGAEAETLVGDTTNITVTLENRLAPALGGIAVTLAESVPGLVITSPPATTLQGGPGTTTTVGLAWTPTEPHRGSLGGLTLSVAGEPDRTIAIAMGHARIADAKSNLPEFEKLDFGRLCIGESKQLAFQMVPGGDNPDVFANYLVTGAVATPPFDARVVSSQVAVGSPPTTATVEVTAMQAISDGIFEGVVRVGTDSPSEPTLDVPVIAEVLQGGATVSPPLLDFREVIVTGFSDTKTATFNNCTAETITITGITLDGESAADFDILQIMPNGVEQLPPFELPRGGDIVIAIQMLPRSNGAKQAAVIIDFQEPGLPDTSSETVALLGEGFLRSRDRNSYYRCSTGAPLQLVPVGFVLGFVVLRRRRR